MRPFDLRDAFAAFYRRRWLGLALVAVTLAATAIGNYLTYPRYEATVKILLERAAGPEIPFSREQIAFKKAEITQTQCELLTSQPVLEEAVRRLRLLERPLPDSSLRDRVHAWWRGLLRTCDQLREQARRFVIERIAGGTYRPPPLRAPLLEAVDALRRQVVAEPIPNTDIIAVTVRDRDADLAAQIANTIGEIYIAADLQAQRSRARQIYELINAQVEQARPAYEAARQAVVDFEQQHQGRVLAERIRAKVQEISELEVAYGELVESQKSRIAGLQMELARLQQIYEPDHPKILAARSELQEARRLLGTPASEPSADADENALAHASTLLARIAAGQNELAELNRLDGQYARLLHEKEQEERLYFSLKQKREEALIAEATRAAGTRVVEPALPPARPARPRKWLNLALALAGGLVLAIAFCGTLEFLDRSVKTPAEVSAAAGELTVLASIPDWRRAGRSVRRGQRRGLIVDVQSRGAYVRSYAALFERLALLLPESRGRLVVLTSAARGEGRTTAAVNLALCAARLGGGRVLLVEADLERPAMASLLETSAAPGLAQVLNDELAWPDALRRPNADRLAVLPAGAALTAARLATAGPRLATLAAEWRAQHDWVFIDTPPLLESAGGSILGRCSDGVLLVVRAGATRAEVLREAAARLRTGSVRVLGAVLNRRSFVIPAYAYRRL